MKCKKMSQFKEPTKKFPNFFSNISHGITLKLSAKQIHCFVVLCTAIYIIIVKCTLLQCSEIQMYYSAVFFNAGQCTVHHCKAF